MERKLCFHEPTQLENPPDLGQVIYNFIRSIDGQPTTEMLNLEESIELLAELQEGIIDSEINSDESIINRWLNFGIELRKNYDIEQYALIKIKR